MAAKKKASKKKPTKKKKALKPKPASKKSPKKTAKPKEKPRKAMAKKKAAAPPRKKKAAKKKSAPPKPVVTKKPAENKSDNPPAKTRTVPSTTRTTTRGGGADKTRALIMPLSINVTINIIGNVTFTLFRNGEEMDAVTLEQSNNARFNDAREGDVLNVAGFCEGELVYEIDRETDPATPRTKGPGNISDSLDIL